MSAPRTTVGNGAEPMPVRSSPVALVVAWAIVGIPALWGLLQTAVKSLALFR